VASPPLWPALSIVGVAREGGALKRQAQLPVLAEDDPTQPTAKLWLC
jgi:hypothetical protein